MKEQQKLLKQFKMGTTEVLILTVLTQGDRYGYEISKEVLTKSDGFFEFKQGFLYPTLSRMERSKFIQGYWKSSRAGGPSRKYYRLTHQGKTRLLASLRAWSDFSKMFNRMLALARLERPASERHSSEGAPSRGSPRRGPHTAKSSS